MSLVYREIEKTIRSLLINDTRLQSILGVNSSEIQSRDTIGHISTISNPTYPCITFSIPVGSLDTNHFSASARLKIDIWSKDCIDICMTIYERIRDLINIKQVSGAGIAQIKEGDYSDDLFEEVTRLYHLSSWYEVRAINS